MSTFELLNDSEWQFVSGGEDTGAPKGTWQTTDPQPAPKGTWLVAESDPAPKGTWQTTDPEPAPKGTW